MNGPTQQQLDFLHRLAELFEVETSFIGTDNQPVEASPETLLNVLRSLGAECEDFDGLDNAYRIRLLQLWHRKLDPVVLAWDGGNATALLRIPESELAEGYDVRLRLESGEEHAWRFERREDATTGGPTVDGTRYFEASLPLTLLPLGYHRLEVDVAGETLTATIIAAPTRAYGTDTEVRDWGVFLPLYSLHSANSHGIGDFSDLRRLAEWTGSKGGRFVGTLPLLTTFLDDPFEPSPYAPVSRLFWSEVHVDTGDASAANETELVDYRGVMASKRRALGEQATAFFANGGSAEFDAFLAAHPDVAAYARFRGVQAKLGTRWREWPEAARRGELTDQDSDIETERFYLYAQWQAQLQMQAVARSDGDGVEIYLDLPVGVHSDGYDAWRYQELFAEYMSVGAPPDPLTSTGQDWGFAPLLPDRLRQTGYRYVAAYLRHNLSLGGLLRIDHIFGMHRLYCLPTGTNAREGVYVRYRTEEMFAVLCLESMRGRTRVIGEDIGITPEGFRETMERHGIGRLYVLTGCIGWNENMPIIPIPPGAMASFGTHDLPPFAAFWDVDDLEERTSLGVLDPALLDDGRQRRAHEKRVLVDYLKGLGLLPENTSVDTVSTWDVMRATQAMLAASPAGHVMVNLEDLWLERRSQNVPGTNNDVHPNWQRRARLSLEEIEADAGVVETLALVAEKRAGAT